MAKEEPMDPEVAKLKEDQKQFKAEQKQEKKEQKAKKKEAKKRAKELAREEARLADESDAGGFPVFITTVVIILVWVAILCMLIKLDVGGFGSTYFTPIFKNTPVIQKILPADPDAVEQEESFGGYSSVRDAVYDINALKEEIARLEENNARKDEQIAAQTEEINRLSTFEARQLEFERIKNEFYNEVVYADNGPGADEYVKYYETMDPATAEVLYKQVIAEEQEDKIVDNYAQAYSEMKPAEAARVFEKMTDNLELVAKILWQMEPDERGAIFNQMDKEIAAKITKIMEPD